MTYGTGSEVPGRGDGSGSPKDPSSKLLPKEEFENVPPSLCRPTPPKSIKINLKYAYMHIKYNFGALQLRYLY